jgi:peptidylprolyl isomerase
MGKVAKGDNVKFHYVGKLKNGKVFFDSHDKEPLEVTVGESRLLPAVEEALVGMEPGENKVLELPSEKAFGPRRESLVHIIGHDQLPAGLRPAVGQRLQLQPSGVEPIIATVTDVADETLTVDANHPLAGHDVIIELDLVEVG